VKNIPRFLGPNTYENRVEDRARFFGREKSIRTVLSSVYPGGRAVIFGASGVGKSSLINCGIIPAIERNGDMIPIRVSLEDLDSNSNQTLRELIKKVIYESVDLSELNSPNKKPFVVILDQFESIFTYGGSGKRAFKVMTELSELANQHKSSGSYDSSSFFFLNPSILISVVEAEIGKLEILKENVPKFARNQYRILGLDKEQIETKVLPQITQTILDNDNLEYETSPFTLSEDLKTNYINAIQGFNFNEILPFFFQLYGAWIEQRYLAGDVSTTDKNGLDEIQVGDIFTEANFQKYLREYYFECLDELDKSKSVYGEDCKLYAASVCQDELIGNNSISQTRSLPELLELYPKYKCDRGMTLNFLKARKLISDSTVSDSGDKVVRLSHGKLLAAVVRASGSHKWTETITAAKRRNHEEQETKWKQTEIAWKEKEERLLEKQSEYEGERKRVRRGYLPFALLAVFLSGGASLYFDKRLTDARENRRAVTSQLRMVEVELENASLELDRYRADLDAQRTLNKKIAIGTEELSISASSLVDASSKQLDRAIDNLSFYRIADFAKQRASATDAIRAVNESAEKVEAISKEILTESIEPKYIQDPELDMSVAYSYVNDAQKLGQRALVNHNLSAQLLPTNRVPEEFRNDEALKPLIFYNFLNHLSFSDFSRQYSETSDAGVRCKPLSPKLDDGFELVSDFAVVSHDQTSGECSRFTPFQASLEDQNLIPSKTYKMAVSIDSSNKVVGAKLGMFDYLDNTIIAVRKQKGLYEVIWGDVGGEGPENSSPNLNWSENWPLLNEDILSIKILDKVSRDAENFLRVLIGTRAGTLAVSEFPLSRKAGLENDDQDIRVSKRKTFSSSVNWADKLSEKNGGNIAVAVENEIRFLHPKTLLEVSAFVNISNQQPIIKFSESQDKKYLVFDNDRGIQTEDLSNNVLFIDNAFPRSIELGCSYLTKSPLTMLAENESDSNDVKFANKLTAVSISPDLKSVAVGGYSGSQVAEVKLDKSEHDLTGTSGVSCLNISTFETANKDQLDTLRIERLEHDRLNRNALIAVGAHEYRGNILFTQSPLKMNGARDFLNNTKGASFINSVTFADESTPIFSSFAVRRSLAAKGKVFSYNNTYFEGYGVKYVNSKIEKGHIFSASRAKGKTIIHTRKIRQTDMTPLGSEHEIPVEEISDVKWMSVLPEGRGVALVGWEGFTSNSTLTNSPVIKDSFNERRGSIVVKLFDSDGKQSFADDMGGTVLLRNGSLPWKSEVIKTKSGKDILVVLENTGVINFYLVNDSGELVEVFSLRVPYLKDAREVTLTQDMDIKCDSAYRCLLAVPVSAISANTQLPSLYLWNFSLSSI